MSKMMNLRPEVYWSPIHEDVFLNWGASLDLYQIQTLEKNEPPQDSRLRIGPRSQAKLIITNKDDRYKCLAFFPGLIDEHSKHIIATGDAAGSIKLVNLMTVPTPEDYSNGDHCEKICLKKLYKKSNIGVSKPPQAVNTLSWNTHAHHYLAAGLEKYQKQGSVQVFDVNRCLGGLNREFLKPVMQYCILETVYSVGFSNQSPQTLFVGNSTKQIKVFDLRDEKHTTTISTKAVNGICFDPCNANRIASYIDSTVHLWDMRNYQNPVLTLPDINKKAVLKIAFCPTRSGFLSALSRESISMRLYDIVKDVEKPSEQVPSVITRYISPDRVSLMASYDWHPTDENRLIAGTFTESFFDFKIQERGSVDWSVHNSLVWSDGGKKLHMLQSDSSKDEADISVLIKERAMQGYGSYTENISINGEVTKDADLRKVWTWLEGAKKMADDKNFTIPGGGAYEYQGVLGFLTKFDLRSETIEKCYIGVDKPTTKVRSFRSEVRNLALALCGWGCDDAHTAEFVARLKDNGQFSRATAVAIFNLNIELAISALVEGAKKEKDPQLNLTAMSLAGYSSDRKGLWRDTCAHLFNSIRDPYLRAVFVFLTEDGETFNQILKEEGIHMHDRVAFACRYLSDVRLLEYLKQLKTNLQSTTSLQGILITGLETEGMELLQRYLHATGDIQTLALIVVHALPSKVADNDVLQNWIESYRSLLDRMKLWNERATMDVILNHSRAPQKIPQQVYISCTWCSKSISSCVLGPGKSKSPYGRFGTGPTSKLKMTACPACRKPLPRCALCLQYMGTPSRRGGVFTRQQTQLLESNRSSLKLDPHRKVLSDFSTWFSWCQTCHHGGHSQHILQWFKEHVECPVTACTCKCMSVDTLSERVSNLAISA